MLDKGVTMQTAKEIAIPDMSLRDYFAIHAPDNELDMKHCSTHAARYAWADEMLEEREKSNANSK